MLGPRPICVLPVLGSLACTARYPESREKAEDPVVAVVAEAPKVEPPVAPPPSAPETTEVVVPNDGAGLIGSGGSTSMASRGGYSGSRGFERFGGWGTRVPTIRLARPEVYGTYDKERLRRTVRAHLRDVRRCYDTALGRDPNAKGRVTIAFEIDSKGKVPAAYVQESTMKDPAAGICIAEATKGWKFARPREGAVKVVFPFVLEPG